MQKMHIAFSGAPGMARCGPLVELVSNPYKLPPKADMRPAKIRYAVRSEFDDFCVPAAHIFTFPHSPEWPRSAVLPPQAAP